MLDSQIAPEKIGWIDPDFKVGDLGSKWSSVPSNTKVGLFHRFLQAFNAFKYEKRAERFRLDRLANEDHCRIGDFVEPLQWITNHLITTVCSIYGRAIRLEFSEGIWTLELERGELSAQKVILAIGGSPKSLSVETRSQTVIQLEIALNPELLKLACSQKDTVAVFGSSHSAFLAMANLSDRKAQIINFFRSPHCYAIYLEDKIFFDNQGLKGFTAEWVKRHIDLPWASNLRRILISDPNFQTELSRCNKVIYAVGFERRNSLIVKGINLSDYNSKTGVIGPNLFGLGLAFPQAIPTLLGQPEFRIGVWKFLDFLHQAFPIWFHSSYLSKGTQESAFLRL